MDKIIVVYPEKCMSCHSCELACELVHTKNKDLIEAIKAGERVESKLILEFEEDSTVPIHCRHCEDAPCMAVCPTGAITRPSERGPVVLNNEKCIGCMACILVCPFGVIRLGSDNKSLIKCDLCFERLEKGQKPACVEACITGAIDFVPVEEYTSKKREEYIDKFKVALDKGEK